MPSSRRLPAVFSTLALAAISVSHAQTAVDGAIGGTVSDSSGAAVPNAQVLIHSNGTAADTRATTDGSGSFLVPHLTSGAYAVTITQPGFETYSSTNVTVQVGLTTNIPAQLALGAETQTVSVSGAAPNIDTTNNDFTAEIGEKVLEDLPVNNYRWSSYALLTPGVVSDQSGFGLLSFRGQSTLLNNITFDGADDNQKFFSEERGRTRAGYSTDKWVVQEFQVNTSNYSTEYGRAAGGVVNAVSKSGSNEFHGEGYLFYRDAVWGAFNDFTFLTSSTGQKTPIKPIDIRRQYGFEVGGPILRDKLFFLVAADRFNHNFPGISVPSNPGIFYGQPDPGAPLNAHGGATTCAATGANAPNSTDSGVCTLAAGLGKPYAQAVPLFNTAISNLNGILGSTPRTGDQTIFFPKLDYQLNAKNHISGVYNRLNWNSPAGIQTSPGSVNYGVRSYGNDDARVNWGIAKLDTLFTPRFSNEVRYQYGRDFEFEFNQQPTAYEQSSLLNTAGGYNNPFNGIPPNVNIGNAFQFGTATFLNRPAYPDERSWQATDTVQYVRGNHSIKFGVDFVHTYDLSENLTAAFGGYSYGGAGNAPLASYITDLYLSQNPATASQATHYQTYTQGFGALGFQFVTVDYAGFAQDEWKVSPRLSLTYGLRYEYEQTPASQLPNTANANSQISLNQTARLPDNRTNIAPRVGFAFQPSLDGKTSIRGGYGIFYARLINSTIYNAIAQTGVLGTSNGTPIAQLQFSYTPQTAGRPTFPDVIPNAGLAGTPPAAIYFDHNFKVPEVQQADLTVEHDFGWNTVISASWLAAYGRRLPSFIDQNLLGNPQSVTYTVVDATGKGPLKAGTRLQTPYYARTASQKVTLANGATASNFRANPYYGSLTDIFSGVNSDYEAAVIQVSHRATNNLQFNANYTYSHALDYGENNTTFSNTSNQYDPLNLRADYGNSNQNVPHRLVLYAVYNTPSKFKGLLGYALNDYEFAPDYQIQSGLPYSPMTTSSSTMLTNDAGQTVNGISTSLNGTDGPSRLGFLGRNSVQYPRTQVFDARLSKRFQFFEKYTIELLGEGFNLANHQNVTAVNTTAYSVGTTAGMGNTLTFNTQGGSNGTPVIPAYQVVTNSNSNGFVYSPRQLQLGARFQF